MKISAAMIVRDGADTLDRCLSSLKGYVDEIVIAIDSRTGDDTPEIAEEYGAKTFVFDWVDDFSYARNLVASKCSYDYILVIDADDWIEPGKDQVLHGALQSLPSSVTFTIQTTNTTSHQSIRIYNRKYAKYVYKIHEYIKYTRETVGSPCTVPITIHHERGKIVEPGRNLRMLSDILNEYPRYLFYAGRDNLDAGNYQKAIQCLEQYLPLSTYIAEKCEAHYLIARAQVLLKNRTAAKQSCFNCILIDPHFAPAYNYLGQIAMVEGQYPLAVRWFEHSLRCNPTNYVFSSLNDTKFNSWGNLIVAYAKTGDYVNARMAVIKADTIFPNVKWIKDQAGSAGVGATQK